MKQDEFIAEIEAALKARITLVWVVSGEELRVERALIPVAGKLDLRPMMWDCARGLLNADNRPEDASMWQPLDILKEIGTNKRKALYVLRDFHKFLDNAAVLRELRSLVRDLQGEDADEARAIVILSPSSEIPPELAGTMTLDWPLPDRPEMVRILDDVCDAMGVSMSEEDRDDAATSAVGLTADGAANAFARSMVTAGRIDPAVIVAEKKRVIEAEKALTWYDPDPRGLDSIGGLDLLKAWLMERRDDLTPEARAYGQPAPKGVVLVGVSGTGKSQAAKALANNWGFPLLQFDPNAGKSKFVGESEQNIRRVFKVVDAVAPVILWIDEIEKAFAGATGEGGDGGVSADAVGAMLTWLQDRAGDVFVIATANDVSKLPPELFRKGRFDEMFYLDLPTSTERREIIPAVLTKYLAPFGHDVDSIVKDEAGLDRAVKATEKFTGAEIDSLVPEAMRLARRDGGRELTLDDLAVKAEATTPLAVTAGDKVKAIQDWAAERKVQPASTPEVKVASTRRAANL